VIRGHIAKNRADHHAAQTEQAYLDSTAQTYADGQVIDAWCISLDPQNVIPNGTTVGTIETYGAIGDDQGGWLPKKYINIASTDAPEYSCAEHNRVQPASSMGTASWFNAYCKWLNVMANNPKFSVGTVTGKAGGTLSVALYGSTPAGSQPKGYPFGDIAGYAVNLVNVPVDYLDCGADPFVVDDRVIVRFGGTGRANPVVIGFAEGPKECAEDGIDGGYGIYGQGDYKTKDGGTSWNWVPGGLLAGNVSFTNIHGDCVSWWGRRGILVGSINNKWGSAIYYNNAAYAMNIGYKVRGGTIAYYNNKKYLISVGMHHLAKTVSVWVFELQAPFSAAQIMNEQMHDDEIASYAITGGTSYNAVPYYFDSTGRNAVSLTYYTSDGTDTTRSSHRLDQIQISADLSAATRTVSAEQLSISAATVTNFPSAFYFHGAPVLDGVLGAFYNDDDEIALATITRHGNLRYDIHPRTGDFEYRVNFGNIVAAAAGSSWTWNLTLDTAQMTSTGTQGLFLNPTAVWRAIDPVNKSVCWSGDFGNWGGPVSDYLVAAAEFDSVNRQTRFLIDEAIKYTNEITGDVRLGLTASIPAAGEYNWIYNASAPGIRYLSGSYGPYLPGFGLATSDESTTSPIGFQAVASNLGMMVLTGNSVAWRVYASRFSEADIASDYQPVPQGGIAPPWVLQITTVKT